MTDRGIKVHSSKPCLLFRVKELKSVDDVMPVRSTDNLNEITFTDEDMGIEDGDVDMLGSAEFITEEFPPDSLAVHGTGMVLSEDELFMPLSSEEEIALVDDRDLSPRKSPAKRSYTEAKGK